MDGGKLAKKSKSKRQKLEKTDGLGPLEKKNLRTAIRQVWHRSHARALVVKRCTDADGYAHCEGPCGRKRLPKITVDHIEPAGEVDGGFIERMFAPSSKLMGLCHECHREKTRAENQRRRAKNKPIGARPAKAKKSVEEIDDFY